VWLSSVLAPIELMGESSSTVIEAEVERLSATLIKRLGRLVKMERSPYTLNNEDLSTYRESSLQNLRDTRKVTIFCLIQCCP
jgi:hypothetical protein